MSGEEALKNLPDGYVLCKHIHQLYLLKPKKKKWCSDNIERITGITIYLYSEKEEKYYPKILDSKLSDRTLQEYIKLRILFYKHNKTNKRWRTPELLTIINT